LAETETRPRRRCEEASLRPRAAAANELLLELLNRFNEEIESYIETVEIMSDPQLLQSIRRGLDDLEAGRTLSLREIRARYGLKAET